MDWQKWDNQLEQFNEKSKQEALKGGAADRDFALAVDAARRSCKDNDLWPPRGADGDFHYTIRQGIKGAIWAREDAAATLHIQRALLKRLDGLTGLLHGLKALIYLCIGLLAYIAYRLH